MTVGELRERLVGMDDQTVLVAGDGREWVRSIRLDVRSVNLGQCTERVAYLVVAELPVADAAPVECDGECEECDRLRDRIDKARAALARA